MSLCNKSAKKGVDIDSLYFWQIDPLYRKPKQWNCEQRSLQNVQKASCSPVKPVDWLIDSAKSKGWVVLEMEK